MEEWAESQIDIEFEEKKLAEGVVESGIQEEGNEEEEVNETESGEEGMEKREWTKREWTKRERKWKIEGQLGIVLITIILCPSSHFGMIGTLCRLVFSCSHFLR